MSLSFSRTLYLFSFTALWLSSFVNALSVSSEIILENLHYKRNLFLSAPKYAVYGASDEEGTIGTQVFKHLLESGKDVVPINPFSSSSQGVGCLQTLSELSDPKHTAISITSHPSVAIEILVEAYQLDVHFIWLHPSQGDWNFVMRFLDLHPEMSERVLYSSPEWFVTETHDSTDSELISAVHV